MLVVLTGTVITGDGATVHEPGHVVIEDGRIAQVGAGRRAGTGAIDVGDGLITPGLVNIHVHCVTLGPAHATGSKSPTEAEVLAFKARHLRGGTTSVLSVDGFPLWAEYEALAARHPLKVRKCTAHTPANVRAAEMADGEGLTDAHRRATVDELIEQGAVCIGEIGAGGTLGGGMQDNIYIPAAIAERSGVQVDPFQARALKEAVLGRTINPANLDRGALREAMVAAGLSGVMTEDAVIETVERCVMPSMEHAYEGLREAAAASARLRRPFMVHHAAASAEVVLEIANDRMIAAHANHPSFTVQESIRYARALRARGALLEISGLNLFTRTKGQQDAEPFLALVRERLADFVGTDYAAGHYDPVSVALSAIVRRGLMTAPEAVALSSGNVARRLPAFTDAGLLEPGRPADVVVFNPDLSAVRAVYVDGRQVFGTEH
ncbi:MAG: amidohydrolase family protein [Armatimonadota bacterium]|nr:amidohydrolase family protein [Armatimonadota bacterium]